MAGVSVGACVGFCVAPYIGFVTTGFGAGTYFVGSGTGTLDDFVVEVYVVVGAFVIGLVVDAVGAYSNFFVGRYSGRIRHSFTGKSLYAKAELQGREAEHCAQDAGGMKR